MQRGEIRAGAKVGALCREHDHAYIRIGRERAKRLTQLARGGVVERVLFLRTGERDASDGPRALDANAHHARCSGSPAARASASGTSITIRSIAEE